VNGMKMKGMKIRPSFVGEIIL